MKRQYLPAAEVFSGGELHFTLAPELTEKAAVLLSVDSLNELSFPSAHHQSSISFCWGSPEDISRDSADKVMWLAWLW